MQDLYTHFHPIQNKLKLYLHHLVFSDQWEEVSF